MKVLVGSMAKRDADGNFLPSRPIYREVPDGVGNDSPSLPNDAVDGLARLILTQLKEQVREGLRSPSNS